VRKPNTPTAFRPINTPTIATRTRRRSGGAEFQCSVSHAAATSFPASSPAPMMMPGWNAPTKIAVRPARSSCTISTLPSQTAISNRSSAT
jgi:hypothetical protein